MAPWHGLLFPAGVSPAIVERASEAARAFLVLPDTKQKFAAQSLEAVPSAPAGIAIIPNPAPAPKRRSPARGRASTSATSR